MSQPSQYSSPPPRAASGVTPSGATVEPARVPGDDRSIGEIVGDLGEGLSTLLRQEVALAKAEASETAKRAGAGAGMFAGAAVAALMVATFVSLALWWVIGRAIGTADAPALAPSGLIVAAIWAVVAAILAVVGRSQMKKAAGVPQTKETLTQIPDALKGHEENNR
ncbi:Putative Holin-X, holin superfamily III [Raineyella antarctica]|uniref:Putative Holin-X, holin superfamily III n=1 Tax=Raineyella antarctica TaxID=1577474 RepID=A0A1G6H3V6_9ACTN|nr:phage holin family protein [Raineyella antarctica]SDB89017.1 Putative Holin-X, holin superfamily III [Raineyella antarctica]